MCDLIFSLLSSILFTSAFINSSSLLSTISLSSDVLVFVTLDVGLISDCVRRGFSIEET